MVKPDADAARIRAERLVRQGLAKPIARVAGFEALFRRLQPASTGPQVRPGSPPRLTHRTTFDSEVAADAMRSTRHIVKGRFQGGGVGYVHRDDLALFANAFRRPLGAMSEPQEQIYDALQFGGPLTPSQIKEETGLLKKRINPALQRLQEAFLVYEDQIDDDWERGWYEFSSEWSEIRLDDDKRESDAAEVVMRFLDAFVFATDEQLRDWSQWPKKRIVALLSDLKASGRIVESSIPNLGEGWSRADNVRLRSVSPEPKAFLLDRGDFLSRAHKSELERRFDRTDVLQYVFAAGEFVGAVRGHWGFKPFDVDDIEMELSGRAVAALRTEVLELVRAAYPTPRHNVLRYAGKKVR